MDKIRLIATAAFGIESLVADELKKLGYQNIKIENGKVEFDGEIKDICKTNIWLRCADRVLIKVAEFKAETFEELYENTKKINWSNYISKDDAFPVSKITSVKSKLFSKSDCQSIIKKGIVDSLRKSYNINFFEEKGNLYDIRVQILNDIVTIAIDTSGDGLHKRGYRKLINEAPMKETLAAALVKLSKYKDENFLDLMCGTGTILIEAAMIAKNMAPGNNRNFISEKWDIIPKKYWIDIRDEAYSHEKKINVKIYGNDIDYKTLEIAKQNIVKAGVEDLIELSCKPFQNLNKKEYGDRGKIVTNPPYGERLNNNSDVIKLYKDMGKIFRSQFENWDYYIITPIENFEKIFGEKANKNRKLYNGGIKCYYYMYTK